jgi:hypothetical protein
MHFVNKVSLHFLNLHKKTDILMPNMTTFCERKKILLLLKGQCHEIFDPPFFRQSINPSPRINTLKYFRILFRICRAIYENVLIPRYAA